MKIKTSLGTDPRIVDQGGNMFRILIDTGDIKHPWSNEKDHWSSYSGDETSIFLYGELDPTCCIMGEEQKPVFSMEGLPKLQHDMWQAVLITGTRWELEFIVCPQFA